MSKREQLVAKRLAKTGKFYLFLRDVHGELFDEEFQAKLATAYGKPRGTKPIAPSFLATVLLLQAYDQVGDAVAVDTVLLDMRWQYVLECMGVEESQFSQGVLVQFRERLIEHNLDQELLARTVAVAKRTGKFGWQHLKATLDSSPLLGAGRVEDIWNLLGRALSTVVTCTAKVCQVSREEVIEDAGLTLLQGRSLKASLDIDWDDPVEQWGALQRLLSEVERVQQWVAVHACDRSGEPELAAALEALHKLLGQDIEPDPRGGGFRVKRGTAPDRMPSLGDPEMRHGRKSKSKKFVGYKRHIVGAQGAGVILGAVALPANQAEHEAADILLPQAAAYGEIDGVAIDRGYLASTSVIQLHEAGKEVTCKPWPCRNRGLYTKEDFDVRLEQGIVVCPAKVEAKIPGNSGTAKFPSLTCRECTQRNHCTTATSGAGRSVSIHPQEAMLIDLRARKRTPEGRAELRRRTEVEHSLARVSAVQGNRARYKGVRKNTFDIRRCAAVVNLQRARFLRQQEEERLAA